MPKCSDLLVDDMVASRFRIKTDTGLRHQGQKGMVVINLHSEMFMTIEKDVVIPKKLIDSMNIDGQRGQYGVGDVYGIIGSFWNGSAKIA